MDQEDRLHCRDCKKNSVLVKKDFMPLFTTPVQYIFVMYKMPTMHNAPAVN